MATRVLDYELRPDEFAFYFKSKGGVDASDLGVFLQRAASISHRHGADLAVVGTSAGSLFVVLRAIGRSKIGRSAQREFEKAPVATTAAGVGIVGAVVGAIVWAMSPAETAPTPIAKAGADIIERCNVEQIEIITINQSVVVMDQRTAAQVRNTTRESASKPPRTYASVPRMIEEAREGALLGKVVESDGEVHVRPDGYRYTVPIQASPGWSEKLQIGEHYLFKADLLTRDGQPDLLIVHSAKREPRP